MLRCVVVQLDPFHVPFGEGGKGREVKYDISTTTKILKIVRIHLLDPSGVKGERVIIHT